MHDIDDLRVDRGGDVAPFKELLRRRFKDESLVDQIVEIDGIWRKGKGTIDLMNKEHNDRSKQISEIKKAKGDADELIAKNKQLDAEISAEKLRMEEVEKKRDSLLRTLPNFVHDSVPIDQDEANNAVVEEWGEPRKDEGLYSHVDLLHMADMVSYDQGTAVAGGRGYYLRGDGVLLNQALINYAIQFLCTRPQGKYTPLQTPFFMQQSIMQEVAQLSQFDDELYKVTGEGEDKYLIATSEQPICAYHRKDRIHPEKLPFRYAGYSTCFRKEVGSHGRDTTGIFRIHQFEKVEQFCVTSPEDDASWKMLEEMRECAAEFYRSLKLPFRVVNIVSGELNDAAAKKYDLEAWFPNSKVFRELVSCSNCTDYQSRRLDIRFGESATKQAGIKEKRFVHMLNATLCATERTMCCIAENYQTDKGIVVPEVLRPFMLGKEIIEFVKPALVVESAKSKKTAAKPAAAKPAAAAASS